MLQSYDRCWNTHGEPRQLAKQQYAPDRPDRLATGEYAIGPQTFRLCARVHTDGRSWLDMATTRITPSVAVQVAWVQWRRCSIDQPLHDNTPTLQ